MAKQNGFALIKAPPQSGKTSLLQLVLNHAEAEGCKGYYLNCSVLIEGQGTSQLDDLLAAECGTLVTLMKEGEQSIQFGCISLSQVRHTVYDDIHASKSIVPLCWYRSRRAPNGGVGFG